MKQFFFILALLIAKNFVSAQTFHFISILESNDPRIGAIKDREKMEYVVTSVCAATNMQIKKYYYNKADLTGQQLKDVVGSMVVGSHDLIWFSYSGHGQSSGGLFPIFVLPTTSEAVQQDDIHTALKAKNGRLTITSYDACNHISDFAQRQGQARSTINPKLLVNLFACHSGDIKICSSKKGQRSYGDERTGGFFTYTLMSIFNAPNTPNNASWEDLLTLSRKETKDVSGQEPYFEINVRRTGNNSGYNTPDDSQVKNVVKF